MPQYVHTTDQSSMMACTIAQPPFWVGHDVCDVLAIDESVRLSSLASAGEYALMLQVVGHSVDVRRAKNRHRQAGVVALLLSAAVCITLAARGGVVVVVGSTWVHSSWSIASWTVATNPTSL